MDHTTYKGKLWGKLHVVWGHFLLWKDVEAHTSHPQLKVSSEKILSKEGELGLPEHNWRSPLPCKIQRPVNDCVKKVKAMSHIALSLAGTAIEDTNVFIWMTPPLIL